MLFDPAAASQWRKCIVTPAKQAAAFVPWQKLTAMPVQLSRGPGVKVVTRVGNGEQTATLSPQQWPARFEEAIEAGPCHLDVLAKDHDWHARRTRDGRWLVTRSRPSLGAPPNVEAMLPAHDRQRQHPLNVNNERVRQLFIETGLFGKNGQLLGEAAPKFRQVQHYIELLRHMPIWQHERPIRVIDAGCGKAYLSLALCLWAELNGNTVHLTGVDSSPDVIETVRAIAGRIGLEDTEFHAQSISEFTGQHNQRADLLLSLHACDTATDEALAAGARLDAKAIVLVPCCHNELSEQIRERSRKGELPAAATWAPVLEQGLTRQRLADLLTDSLRASALAALGYEADVVEFVSPEATAKNLMIRAVRPQRAHPERFAKALEQYRALATEWNVRPALEELLGDLWPPSLAPQRPRPGLGGAQHAQDLASD